jgi:hypothetical protein
MSQKKQKSTFQQFSEMSQWLMKDMDKEPRNQSEMMAQSFGAVGRTFVFIGWIYAKTFGFILKKIIGGIRMVLRKKKKKDDTPSKDDPSFISDQLAKQLAESGQSMGIPSEFPVNPSQTPVQSPAQPPVQSPAQPPVQPPAQPPSQQPPNPPASPPANPAIQPPTDLPVPPTVQQPAPQPVQQPAEQPVQPPAQPQGVPMPVQQDEADMLRRKVAVAQADEQTSNVLESFMQAFISLGDKIKEHDQRLAIIEQQIDDLYNRLNLVQGVQPSASQRIRFEKRS